MFSKSLNDIPAATVLLLLCAVSSLGENVCDCPSPPGGQIQCDNNQVAFCRISEGKVIGTCKAPPRDQREGTRLQAWVILELTGERVSPDDISKRPELKRIITQGEFTNPKTGEIIRFRLPKG